MIEENTQSIESEQGPSVQEAFGDKLGEDELRRLEWAGIRSVSQLRELPISGQARTQILYGNAKRVLRL